MVAETISRLGPRRQLFHRHREARGSQFVGWTRQAIDEPEHDIELRSIRDRWRGEVDVNRAGASVRRV